MVIDAIQSRRQARHEEAAKALSGLGVSVDLSWQKNYFGPAPVHPHQLKNFYFQVQKPIAPASTELIGKGKAKLVYSGFIEQAPSSWESRGRDLLSKVDDVVYMVSRKRFFGDELQEELRLGPKIREQVYHANLEKYFESLEMPRSRAKLLSNDLCKTFPTLEGLVEGFYAGDPRLKEFYVRHGLGPVDWNCRSLQRLLDSCLHLSVDFVYAPTILIHGKSAVVAKRAECDLESAVRKRQYPLPQKIDMVRQLFLGFRDLHAGGIVHGDIKLENILLYNMAGKPLVKVADWGKSKMLAHKEVAFHTGNHRHMAPERLSSQKGEVFGVGMLAVRILEEEFLADSPQGMLVLPEQIDPTKERYILPREGNPEQCRKGIEKYLCICSGCPEIDANWSDAIRHIWGSLKSYVAGSYPNIDPHVEAYLDALHGKLRDRYGDSAHTAEIIVLLKAMMRTKVADRLTMEEVVDRFDALKK